jgi:hypothetical protein
MLPVIERLSLDRRSKPNEHTEMRDSGGIQEPLILHCHIPKTAGTTVSTGLRCSFDIFHFHHFHPDPFYILRRETLEELLEIDPYLKSITSHHLRSFPLSIGDRPTFLMTFLRKPEDTFISQLRHIQRKFSSFPEQVRCLWPKDTPSLTLRELARRCLDTAAASSHDFCPQTRFLCNPNVGARFGLWDGHNYGLDNYDVARLILSEFHFVGIVEEMKKSLELLTDRLLQLGIRVYFKFDLKLNTGEKDSRLDWLTPEDEVGQRVLAAGKNDRLLHDYFLDELFRAHADLRKRRWLGFRPAAADVKEALSDGWRDATRSLINSTQLYWSKKNDHIDPVVVSPLCADLLELRAAQAVRDRTHVTQAVR